jgi:hypothetical protein
MSAGDTTQGLPDELKGAQALWETRQEATPNRAATAVRLYENGQLYSWSNSRRRMVDGRLTRVPAPYAWRLDAQVSPEGVDRVRELIRSGFVSLESGPPARAQDQGTTIRRSFLDGVDHTVALPASAAADLPQVIRDIDSAIATAIIPGAVAFDQ